MKNSLLRIKLNCNENVAKQVQTLNENKDKKSQNTHVKVNIFASKSQTLEVGFGLFRIIFTLPKLKQKELAQNSTEIFQLK